MTHEQAMKLGRGASGFLDGLKSDPAGSSISYLRGSSSSGNAGVGLRLGDSLFGDTVSDLMAPVDRAMRGVDIEMASLADTLNAIDARGTAGSDLFADQLLSGSQQSWLGRAADTVAENPVGFLGGIGQGLLNFGPSLVNGAVDLAKFSAGGWAGVLNQAGLISEDSYQGFLGSDPAHLYTQTADSDAARLGMLTADVGLLAAGVPSLVRGAGFVLSKGIGLLGAGPMMGSRAAQMGAVQVDLLTGAGLSQALPKLSALTTRFLRDTQVNADFYFLKAQQLLAAGRLPINSSLGAGAENAAVGSYVDRAVRSLNRQSLAGLSAEEQSGIQINRWLRDPNGSGQYRIPDQRYVRDMLTVDITVGNKGILTPQLYDFSRFAPRNNVLIIQPNKPATLFKPYEFGRGG